MASPDAFKLYERARDARCNLSSPRPANLLTAPGQPSEGTHGTAPASFDVVLRDQ